MEENKVTLVSVTSPIPSENGPKNAEELMVYIARVSNPSNQLNHETGPRLLRYCLRNGHWSVFESVYLTMEFKTSRAIAAQMLRHRSFTFQEFSQRYSAASTFEPFELRQKGLSNRQGSEAPTDPEIVEKFQGLNEEAASLIADSFRLYNSMLEHGVAAESARFVLPLCTQTTLYMTGSARSWIHYFQQRCHPHAQKEHRILAEKARELFSGVLPSLASAAFDPHE